MSHGYYMVNEIGHSRLLRRSSETETVVSQYRRHKGTRYHANKSCSRCFDCFECRNVVIYLFYTSNMYSRDSKAFNWIEWKVHYGRPRRSPFDSHHGGCKMGFSMSERPSE